MNFLTKQTFVVNAADPDNFNSSLKIEDITNLATIGLDPANVDSVLTVTDPLGNIIHQNTNFDSPDLDYDVSRELTIGSLDEDLEKDLPIGGKYSYTMNTRVKSLSTPYVFSTPAINQIKISEAITIDESATVEITASAGPNPSPNVGTYTISSVSYDSDGYPTITLSTNLEEQISPGNPLSEVVSVGLIEYFETFKIFSFEFEYPNLSIEVESECDLATLEVTDNTLFSYPIDSDSRNGIIKYPENAVSPPDDVVFSSASKKIGELYTGAYNVVITRDVTFILDSTENTYVECGLVGAKKHVVDCSTSLCCVSNCLQNLIDRYEDALCEDQQEADRLSKTLQAIVGKIVLARIIKTCGQTGYRDLLEEIMGIFSETGCDCGCDEEDDGLSRKVTPIASVLTGSGIDVDIKSTSGDITISVSTVGSTTEFDLSISADKLEELSGKDGATIHVVPGVPTPSLGNTGDIAISGNGDLYEKIEQSSGPGQPAISGWVLVTNLKGPGGQAGSDGVDGSTLLDGETVPDDADGEDGDYYFRHNGEVYFKDSGSWALVFTIPYGNTLFITDDDPPAGGTGVDGDFAIVESDIVRLFRKESGSWVFKKQITKFFRQFQDPTAQLPLPSNPPTSDAGILNYEVNKDVYFKSETPNAYELNAIVKKDSDQANLAITEGEEVRFVNVGDANIIIGSDIISLSPDPTIKVVKLANDANMTIPPGGSVTFKYIPEVTGASGDDLSDVWTVVAKSF